MQDSLPLSVARQTGRQVVSIQLHHHQHQQHYASSLIRLAGRNAVAFFIPSINILPKPFREIGQSNIPRLDQIITPLWISNNRKIVAKFYWWSAVTGVFIMIILVVCGSAIQVFTTHYAMVVCRSHVTARSLAHGVFISRPTSKIQTHWQNPEPLVGTQSSSHCNT